MVKYQGKTLSKTYMDRKTGLEIMEDIQKRDGCEVLLSGEETSYLVPKSREYLDHIKNFVGNNVTLVKDKRDGKNAIRRRTSPAERYMDGR